MGRGRSKGGRRGDGGSFSGELILPDGSKIEYDGTLVYDGLDRALTGAARTAISDWESKRVKANVEYGYAVDANGVSIGKEIKGGKGTVRTPASYTDTPGGTFSHIHPRGDGVLGGTFSFGDLIDFARFKGRTTRAATKEGTYSISKGKNFDPTGFRSFAAIASGKFDLTYRKKAKSLAASYRSGAISYDEYLKSNAKALNTALIMLHETYRSGQKKYGYFYTLEKTN